MRELDSIQQVSMGWEGIHLYYFTTSLLHYFTTSTLCAVHYCQRLLRVVYPKPGHSPKPMHFPEDEIRLLIPR